MGAVMEIHSFVHYSLIQQLFIDLYYVIVPILGLMLQP